MHDLVVNLSVPTQTDLKNINKILCNLQKCKHYKRVTDLFWFLSSSALSWKVKWRKIFVRLLAMEILKLLNLSLATGSMSTPKTKWMVGRLCIGQLEGSVTPVVAFEGAELICGRFLLNVMWGFYFINIIWYELLKLKLIFRK